MLTDYVVVVVTQPPISRTDLNKIQIHLGFRDYVTIRAVRITTNRTRISFKAAKWVYNPLTDEEAEEVGSMVRECLEKFYEGEITLEAWVNKGDCTIEI